MVKASKDRILLQFKRWSQIVLSFDSLVFLNVKGDISICSPRSSINISWEENLVFAITIPWRKFLTNKNYVKEICKRLLNSCKLRVVFKSKRKLSNVFCFKDRLSFDLVSRAVYKYTCSRINSTYYGEMDRHLKVRSEEHIGISPLIFKKTKLSKESEIGNHLFNCNNVPSFEEFTILTNGNNKFVL